MAPGVRVELDAGEVDGLAAALRRASRASRRTLLEGLAAVGEAGARSRIAEGGPGPEGETWQPRHPLDPSQQPLLNRAGHLGDSITARATASQAHWGSNRIYARIHQLGGVIRPKTARALRFQLGDQTIVARSVTIPARPYLGWGRYERREAGVVIRRWLDAALGAPA